MSNNNNGPDKSWLTFMNQKDDIFSGGSNQKKNDEKKVPSVLIGAAAAGGIVGAAIAGPIIGLAAAGGAAYASTQKNAAGDAARSTGEFMVAVGDKAKEVDQKHHIVDNTKKAGTHAWNETKKFEEKTHIGQKTADGIGNAFKWMTEQLNKGNNNKKQNYPENDRSKYDNNGY